MGRNIHQSEVVGTPLEPGGGEQQNLRFNRGIKREKDLFVSRMAILESNNLFISGSHNYQEEVVQINPPLRVKGTIYGEERGSPTI